MRFLKNLVLIVSAAALVACGGGGDSAPVASQATFNLYEAFVRNVETPSIRTFSISGNSGNLVVSGSGTETRGALAMGVFEGKSAKQRTTVVSGTITEGATTLPLNGSITSYYDANSLLPLGEVDSEYTVVVGQPTLPTSVRVGDTGTLAVANRYGSSTKISNLGTLTFVYVIEADTSNSAIIKIIGTTKNRSGTTTEIETTTYRLNSNNTMTKLQSSGVDLVNNISLTATFQ